MWKLTFTGASAFLLTADGCQESSTIMGYGTFEPYLIMVEASNLTKCLNVPNETASHKKFGRISREM